MRHRRPRRQRRTKRNPDKRKKGAGTLLLVPKITKKMVEENPGVIFLFADNFAKEGPPSWRDAKNAVGIPMKRDGGRGRSSFLRAPKRPQPPVTAASQEAYAKADAAFHSRLLDVGRAFIRVKTYLVNGHTVVSLKGGLADAVVTQESREVSLLIAQRLHALNKEFGVTRAEEVSYTTGKKEREKAISGGPSQLPDCSAYTDLYILPITPVTLMRYLNAVLLSLAGSDAVGVVLQRAASRKKAGELLESGHLGIKAGQVAPLYQADAGAPRLLFKQGRAGNLRDLSLQVLGGDWADLREMLVTPGEAYQGLPSPSMGIYEDVLGRIGTPKAALSAFGSKRKIPGAASLQDLMRAFEISLQTRVSHPDKLPTYFLVPDGYRGKPVALVIMGSIGTLEGMTLHEPEPDRPLILDLVAISDAIVTALPAGVSREACFLLPPSVMTGWGKREKEVTGRQEFQDVLLGKMATPSPFLHFEKYAQLLRSAYSRNPVALARLQGLDDVVIGFGKVYPADERSEYFGAMPYIQDWPGMYAKSVLHLLRGGMGRAEIGLRAAEEGWTLPAFVATRGKKEDLPHHTRAFQKKMRKVRATQELDKKREERIAIDDLPFEEIVSAVFMENRAEGPGQRQYVPGSLVRTSSTGVQTSPRGYAGPRMAQIRQLQAANHDNPKALATVATSLVLLNRKNIEASLHEMRVAEGKDAEESRKKAFTVVREVRELLKREALVLDGKSKDEAVWFLGITRAEVRQVSKDGEEIIWGRKFPAASARLIPNLARGAFLTDLGWRGHAPTLRFVPTKPTMPWVPEQGGYLLDEIELRSAVETPDGKTEFRSMWANANNPKQLAAYLDGVKKVFGRTMRSSAVIGGESAALSARAYIGKVTKKGKRVEQATVPIAGQNMPRGFWAWAMQVVNHRRKTLGLDLAQLSKKKKMEAERTYVIEKNWPLLLQMINEERKRHGRELLPADTPPPTDPGHPTLHLEKETLTLLVQLLDYSYEPVLPDLLRPQDNRVAQLGDAYPDEIQEGILSIENPDGRRPRRRRRTRRHRRPRGQRLAAPRRSRPRKNPRKNPLKEEDWDKLHDWLATPKGQVVQLTSLKAPETNEEFEAALAALFPLEKVGVMKLRPKVAFSALEGHDFFPKFRGPTAKDALEKKLRDWSPKKDPLADGARAEEFQKYIAGMAGMSVQEGREIMEARRLSRRRGSALSPSGALCKLYRNAPRLRGYTPPTSVRTPRTAWIWVGKSPGEQGQIRIMTYRNGMNVDCDQVVKGRHTFGRALGKAIEGMILWLAERPERRMDRARGYTVFIGHVGSNRVRKLWQPGDSLNAHLLLKNAYESPLAPALRFDEEADQQDYWDALPKNQTFEWPDDEPPGGGPPDEGPPPDGGGEKKTSLPDGDSPVDVVRRLRRRKASSEK